LTWFWGGNTDKDGDGLSNEDEKAHGTNSKIADSDGDGLTDGSEVLTHETDPLKADSDSDGGSVNDGIEVARGTNPGLADDDVAKPEAVPATETQPAEVGKAIVLEGVVFETGSSSISPASEAILNKAFNTLNEHGEIVVEIRGHTDNTGSRVANLKLSQARAEAVRAFLETKGIAGHRMIAKGVGPDQPIADDSTLEGRQKNRRIEFVRTK
jgi:outer membrane protein OmpA-like peptidoglycan-associated protein